MGLSLLTLPFCGWYSTRYYGGHGVGMVMEQLEQALSLSLYLFVIAMFVSYEYFKKFRADGIAEAAQTTEKGKESRQFFSAYLILSLWAIIVTVLLIICAVYTYSFYEISDPNGEYVRHIILNMILNIFLIMELASLIGAFLSGGRSRIISYLVMIFAAYMVSPYPERIADSISRSTNGNATVYWFVEACNILPLVNTNFTPNLPFGESLLPYRIAIILFWCVVFLTGIIFSSRRTRKWGVIGLAAAAALFAVYSLPSSKVIMNSNPENTVGHDQYYYLVQDAEIKDEKAEYKISAYQMDISIGLEMSADVVMDVSQSLPEYKMSLYHGYKVKSAYDGSGNVLSFTQEGDYLTVTNSVDSEIGQIRLVYEGYSPAYYSNVQGIFLPGYFAYYPRAGFVTLYDYYEGGITECFVDADTEFAVKINTHQTLYTNLEKDGDWYRGKCDGFTVVSGFYKEKELSNGNRLIYPYLYDFDGDSEAAGDEALEEYYESMETRLEELGRENTTVFCGPNVNQMVNRYEGEKQIISKSIAI
jgi:hypothetical protein